MWGRWIPTLKFHSLSPPHIWRFNFYVCFKTPSLPQIELKLLEKNLFLLNFTRPTIFDYSYKTNLSLVSTNLSNYVLNSSLFGSFVLLNYAILKRSWIVPLINSLLNSYMLLGKSFLCIFRVWVLWEHFEPLL